MATSVWISTPRRRAAVLGVAAVLAVPAVAGAREATRAEQVGRVLDRLHQAASGADAKTYFSLFDKTAVFIGTDVSEHWTLPQFKAYALPRFEAGKGWTYVPKARSVTVDPKCKCIAWFDEVLDSPSYGTSRGTGVLVRRHGNWKVAQYALTFPIPNALADETTAKIRAYEAGRPPGP